MKHDSFSTLGDFENFTSFLFLREQHDLKLQLVEEDSEEVQSWGRGQSGDPFADLHHIAGVDISFEKGTNRACAMLVILDFPELKVCAFGVSSDYPHSQSPLSIVFASWKKNKTFLQCGKRKKLIVETGNEPIVRTCVTVASNPGL